MTRNFTIAALLSFACLPSMAQDVVATDLYEAPPVVYSLDLRDFVHSNASSSSQTKIRRYIEGENPVVSFEDRITNLPDYLHIFIKKYREEGFPVTIVRPSHTYDEGHIPLGVHGKKGFYQVIKRMIDGKPVIIQGDGTSLWHVTFNRDFATGYIGLMLNRHAIGEAFQITGDEVLSWNQIYQTIADALGVELKAYHVASDYLSAAGDKLGFDFEGSLTGDKSVSVVFDNSKLKRLVPQMSTTVPFHDGVRIALDYVMSHPECQIEDKEFDDWCDKVISVLEESKKNF